MDDHTMGRRRLLRGAGVATGGAVMGGLAMSAPAHADDHDQRSRAEGSWLVTRFDPADGLERTFVFNLSRGGTCFMNDISPVFITGQGAWKSRGRRMNATVWVGVPESPAGPAITFKVDIVGDVDGDQMSGTFTYVVFLPDLTTPIGDGGGTWDASRITA